MTAEHITLTPLAEPCRDSRVTQAREYLTHIRRVKVTGLPVSVLERECAELRRNLGQLLDVLDSRDEDVSILAAAVLDQAEAANEVAGWLTNAAETLGRSPSRTDLARARIYRVMALRLAG
jgi:hypothetical protein